MYGVPIVSKLVGVSSTNIEAIYAGDITCNHLRYVPTYVKCRSTTGFLIKKGSGRILQVHAVVVSDGQGGWKKWFQSRSGGGGTGKPSAKKTKQNKKKQ